MARPLLLVDSASLYFRAFFGVPEKAAVAPDGTPVNAVRGFLDMLSTLVRGRRPDRLVCCLDESWRPAWRVALLPSYKSHRLTPAGGEEVPDALSVQVPIILEFLAALGITAVGAHDFEADDVIGTLATREPGPVEVATGDRDLFQLIDDARGVTVLYCGRGVAKLEVLDNTALHAKYGVPAAGYADFAALRGDPSDGLPGVAGVGEKTAARLVDRYGDLDGILAALDDPASGFAPGLRAKIVAGRDYLTAARDVVAVARTIDLGDVDTKLPTSPADPDALLALAERWGLEGAARRIVDALAA
ncbi:5'-3' exonuclease [Dactylosporangium sp. NPDC005555]|uniref:5'-3' exonuclease n=1 Tax=Dactylosporangium sp. NPDC005555 TaxID=3154889 RepID=UPI0033BBF3DB